MYAVWILCLSNLKRKKVQNSLMAILILISTLLIVTAVAVISNTKSVFTDMHDDMQGAHEMLELEGEIHDPFQVNKWWKQQAGVTASELTPYRDLSGAVHEGKEIPNLGLYMMNTTGLPAKIDKPVFAQGKASLQPEPGSIWIPTSMAKTYGVAIGDRVGFSTGINDFELKVSGILVDIPYGGPFTISARIWMNGQDYEKQLDAMQGKEKYMMGLRFDDYGKESDYWSRFEEYFGVPYMEGKTDFNSISSFYLILNMIIGFVMSFLGVVMMFIAIFTIGFTISDAILSNYKTIGVIKSIGLTSRQTIGTYVIQYGILAVIGIIPGLIASSFVSRMIIESSLSFLKTGDSDLPIRESNMGIIIGISIFIIILLCVWFYANKTRSIQPVQAIRYGMSEANNSKLTRRLGKTGTNKIGFQRFPVILVIGLRAILKSIKGSSLMLMLAVVTSAVLVIGYVLINSILSINENPQLWGYDNSHIAVNIFNKSALSRADFEKDVLSDSRVKNIGWAGYANSVFPSVKTAGSKKENTEPLNIQMTVIDGKYTDLGFTTARGRDPQNKNEISLGVNVAKYLNKEIGDVVEVYIQGKKHNLTISGIYQSIANMSYNARITADVVKVENSVYDNMTNIFINLNDSSLSKEYVKELNVKYKESIKALTQQTLIDAVFKDVVALLMWPMLIMGLIFMFVTFIIIYSTCRINIKKEGKTYGIYKSIGMTSFKIRLSVTVGIAALSAIGSFIGIFVGVYVLPAILKGLLANYGIIKMPLALNWGGITAIALISVISACFGSWISSRVIERTSPRILVVE